MGAAADASEQMPNVARIRNLDVNKMDLLRS